MHGNLRFKDVGSKVKMLKCMKKDKEKKNQYKLGNFDTTI